MATEPTAPTRSSYTFGGWYTDAACTTAGTFASDAVTTNITLYAKWTPTSTTYSVTFDSQGGSAVAAQTVASGGTATEPTAPTRSGYTFGGWYTAASGGIQYSFSSAVTGGITLYARWSNTADDSEDFSGGTPDAIFAVGDSAAAWNAAQTAIAAGGDNKNYVINVDDTLGSGGVLYDFGAATGIVVSIRGTGEFHFALNINSGQTFILRGPTIRSAFASVMVSIQPGGTFIMESGSITAGAGVSVNGDFIMNGGSITGNTNGVSVNSGGNFTMNDGSITGNTSYGVFISSSGTFTINCVQSQVYSNATNVHNSAGGTIIGGPSGGW
jgi:uncharacterized repeat protein (TIGR02543 family)